MEKRRLSYDEWNCILSKEMIAKQTNTSFFQGFLELINIKEVSERQIWKFNGEDIVVCDNGMKWISILPQDDFYCITAVIDKNAIMN